MAKHGGVKDSGEHFVINPTSRKVTVPHAHKSIATVGDHNSEQIVFACPQMVDGHDVSQCARRYITWINVNGEVGHDELQVAQVEQGEEGILYLSWTIRDSLTVAKGVVQFSVHFEDVDDDGAILYRWGTATCKDCDILDGINAVLSAYEAMYVAGDTFVIANYTPIKDETLEFCVNGIVPEGIKPIQQNGIYDVGQYSQVEVNVVAKEDANLIPENIKPGVTIAGVTGILAPYKNVQFAITNRVRSYTTTTPAMPIAHTLTCHYIQYNADNGYLLKHYVEIPIAETVEIQVAQNTMVYITTSHPTNSSNVKYTSQSCQVSASVENSERFLCVVLVSEDEEVGNCTFYTDEK